MRRKAGYLLRRNSCQILTEFFSGSGVNITTEGKSYLGAPLGTTSSKESAIADKVNQWVKEIDLLVKIAHLQPQSPYCALTNGLMSRWNYLMHVVPNLGDKLQPIEEDLWFRLSDAERLVFALPARDCRLGILIPTEVAAEEYRASRSITELLVAQGRTLSTSRVDLRVRGIYLVHHTTHQSTRILLAQAGVLRCFVHSKWLEPTRAPKPLPMWCSIQHHTCLQLPQRSISNNLAQRIHDLTAQFLTKVCPSVEVESQLQPLSRETFPHQTTNLEDNARLNVKALDSEEMRGNVHSLMTFLLSVRNNKPIIVN